MAKLKKGDVLQYLQDIPASERYAMLSEAADAKKQALAKKLKVDEDVLTDRICAE